MKEILEILIKNLVDNKEEVIVNQTETEREIKLEVKVADSEMGRIIGRQGKIAKSIRTVMKAIAAKENKRITIEFIG